MARRPLRAGRQNDRLRQTGRAPARSLMRELVELVGEEIAELGTEKEIAPIEQILANGTSADRQLRVYNESGGDVKAVVDHLAAETIEGL